MIEEFPKHHTLSNHCPCLLWPISSMSGLLQPLSDYILNSKLTSIRILGINIGYAQFGLLYLAFFLDLGTDIAHLSSLVAQCSVSILSILFHIIALKILIEI